jgi:hypothetical protein
MQLNADTPIASVGWNLSIVIAGVPYPIREMTLKEFRDAAGRPMEREQEMDFVLALIADDRKPERQVLEDDDLRDRVTTMITAYVTGLLEKKREASRAQVAALLGGRPSTSG